MRRLALATWLAGLLVLPVPAGLAIDATPAQDAPLQRPAGGVEQDPLHRYLRAVLCRLSTTDCGRVRLLMLEGGAFDTRLSADGVLVMQVGTLLRLRDEDELTVLLGHELAHLEAGHAAARASMRGRAARHALARRQEQEADARGRALAEAAGYDPGAASTLWTRRARERAAVRGAEPWPSIYPPPAERAAAAPRPAGRSSASAARYCAAIAPHLGRWLLQVLDDSDPGEGMAVLHALHRDAPTDWRGRTGFALGEAHRRRGEAGDAATALALFTAASSAPDAPAAVFRELGHLLAAAGEADSARAAFRRYLDLAPNAEDRAFFEPSRAPAGPKPTGSTSVVLGLRVADDDRWDRRDSAFESRWTRQGGAGLPLRLLSGIAPGEHLLVGRRPEAGSAGRGTFDSRLRLDEWPRMLRQALRDAGWLGVEARAVRPWRFGRIDGVRFGLAMAHPDGTPHLGEAAMLVRGGRLTLAYWQAPSGPRHQAEAAAVAAMLDSLQAD